MKQITNNLKEWYKLIVLLNLSADYSEVAKYDNTTKREWINMKEK
jgi:hypothetical protein